MQLHTFVCALDCMSWYNVLIERACVHLHARWLDLGAKTRRGEML